MSAVKWTPEQLAVHEAMAKHDQHLMVQAVAGSGKTATVVGGTPFLPDGSWFSTFNKNAAYNVLEPRLRAAGSRAKARTLHSLGFGLVTAAARAEGITTQLDTQGAKLNTILEKYLPEPRNRQERMAWNDAKKLVQLCKSWLLDGTERIEVEALCDDHALILEPWYDKAVDAVPFMLMDCQRLDYVDFDDQVWLPAVMGLAPKTPAPVGIVDEAQDMNRAQHVLVKSLADRLIFIGDARQALYRFRGADSESMDRLARELGTTGRGCETLGLTVNWRCGRKHIELAQRIVPQIQAHDRAVEGEVAASGNEVFNRMDGDWVGLCRTNAPLMEPALGLMRRGQRAVIRGRDFGQGLENLVGMLAPLDPADLLWKVSDYEARERNRLLGTKHGSGRISALEDRCNALRVLAENCSTMNDVYGRLRTLFGDTREDGAAVFSTVHRFKGDERPHVAVIAPELMPHPRASEADAVTEENIMYVTVTRPKQSLTWVGEAPGVFGEAFA